MHPLGNRLTNAATFDSELKSVLTEGHIIGFLIDSKMGDLNRSGLISQSESVMTLHNLLGSKATIFYPNPQDFNQDEYKQFYVSIDTCVDNLEDFMYFVDRLLFGSGKLVKAK
jgi:hypothetical protein